MTASFRAVRAWEPGGFAADGDLSPETDLPQLVSCCGHPVSWRWVRFSTHFYPRILLDGLSLWFVAHLCRLGSFGQILVCRPIFLRGALGPPPYRAIIHTGA